MFILMFTYSFTDTTYNVLEIRTVWALISSAHLRVVHKPFLKSIFFSPTDNWHNNSRGCD